MEGEGKGDKTPIRAKARANPNSWETHLARKRWDIGLLWSLSSRFMMMGKHLLALTDPKFGIPAGSIPMGITKLSSNWACQWSSVTVLKFCCLGGIFSECDLLVAG